MLVRSFEWFGGLWGESPVLTVAITREVTKH
jgi:hypothetical protein